MSSYICNTKNPATGEFEAAQWLDNYFGPRHYGVKFLDGSMVDPEEVELETNHDELIDLKPSDPEATLRPSKSPNHIEPNIVPNDNTDGPMTSAKSTSDLDGILSWYYLGDEDRYTPEAWDAHKAGARAAILKNYRSVEEVERAIQDEVIDESDELAHDKFTRNDLRADIRRELGL